MNIGFTHFKLKISGSNWLPQILVASMVFGFNDLKAGDAPILGSPVMTLIENSDGEQLSRLVKLGLSPNSQVYERGKLVEPFTLLEYACFLEKEAAIRVLINSGADLKLRSKLGEFPVEMLIQNNRRDLAALLALKEQKRTDEETFEHIVCEYLLRTYDSARKKDGYSPIILINGKKPGQTFEVLLNSLFPKTEKSPGDKIFVVKMTFDLSFHGPFGKDTVIFKLTLGDGPLSGGIVSTEYQLQYGYWIPGKFKSMDR